MVIVLAFGQSIYERFTVSRFWEESKAGEES